ncbi:MAG: D-threonate 4-phosphate dehydrogenase [Vulcanimicrobiaceae bacterium]
MKLPTIGLTMGDAAGVGPEVIAKTLADGRYQTVCRPLVIGDASVMRRAAALVRSPQAVRIVDDVAAWAPDLQALDVVDLALLGEGDVPFGKLSARAGDAAFRYLERANELALAGRLDALCTAPLNKEALHAGGHLYPGHTEILAELSGTSEFAMMLTAPNLRVIHVTTHIGLIEAIARITPERVFTVVRLAHETLVRAHIARPRIGVCGINPHAGENGLFGYGEEAKQIVPALERARAAGIAVEGPLPADTLFFRARRGDFDVVVAMYHDQGHGPVKVLGLENGVNITVGLPYVRTSVDHGTAFDIAGTGQADDGSMRAALDAAIALAP